MMEYQKMYLALFNAITDALTEIERMNYGNAIKILQKAQVKTEAIYIDSGEKIQGGENPSP